MDFSNYVQDISFKLIRPDTSNRLLLKLNRELKLFNIPLELANTRLPEGDKEMKSRLYKLLGVPKMSTLAIGAIINKAVSAINDNNCFVNVGVWNGFTLLAGIMNNRDKRCVGVDNFSQFGGPRDQFLEEFNKYKSSNHFFYDMDYKDYFTNIHTGEIGFYLYDGEHSYENQMEGLQVAEPFFSQNCYILVDDTNWDAPRQATLDFMQRSSNEYKILLDRTTCKNRHPTFWNGIMLLQRVK